MSKDSKLLRVKCPHCKKKFVYFDSSYRPFCSEECKMIDLGHWLTETYSIGNKDNEREEESNESNKLN